MDYGLLHINTYDHTMVVEILMHNIEINLAKKEVFSELTLHNCEHLVTLQVHSNTLGMLL